MCHDREGSGAPPREGRRGPQPRGWDDAQECRSRGPRWCATPTRNPPICILAGPQEASSPQQGREARRCPFNGGMEKALLACCPGSGTCGRMHAERGKRRLVAQAGARRTRPAPASASQEDPDRDPQASAAPRSLPKWPLEAQHLTVHSQPQRSARSESTPPRGRATRTT